MTLTTIRPGRHPKVADVEVTVEVTVEVEMMT